MFEVGFSEICLVALVSLIVIGPEKLPEVARVVGFWLGKARNMVAAVKAEIKQELDIEQTKQLLEQPSSWISDLNQSTNQLTQNLRSEFNAALQPHVVEDQSIVSIAQKPVEATPLNKPIKRPKAKRHGKKSRH